MCCLANIVSGEQKVGLLWDQLRRLGPTCLICLAVPAWADSGDKPDLHAGDRWSWQHINGLVNEKDYTRIEDVIDVSPKEVHVRIRRKGTPGMVLETYTADLNPVDTGGERYDPSLMRFEFPLQAGKKWNGTFDKMLLTNGKHGKFYVKAEVGALEKVSVPAGGFDAYKVTLTYDATATDDDAMTGQTVETIWYAPTVKNVVKSDTAFTRDGQLRSRDDYELLEYSLR
jgi:hypothetical protein